MRFIDPKTSIFFFNGNLLFNFLTFYTIKFDKLIPFAKPIKTITSTKQFVLDKTFEAWFILRAEKSCVFYILLL